MGTPSVRTVARECLRIAGPISVKRDILGVPAPSVPSLRSALEFIHRNRCRPKAPTNLQVTGAPPATQNVGLLWIDSADNEDGFRVRFRGKRVGFGDDEGTKTLEPNETSTLLRNLRNGFEYTISLVAFNAAGESAPSNEVKVRMPNVEETRQVSLRRQQIPEGLPPYFGKFPEGGVVPKGHLRSIRLPQLGFGGYSPPASKTGLYDRAVRKH